MAVTRRAFNQILGAAALAASAGRLRAAEPSLPAYDGPWVNARREIGRAHV